MSNHTVETRVALVEHRQEDNEKLIEKLSQAIQAIQDLASSLNQVIKIHEFKLDQRILAERDLYETIEQNQEDVDQKLALLEQKYETAADRFETKLDMMQVRITSTINENLIPLKVTVGGLETQVQKYRYWTWAAIGALVAISFFIPGGMELLKVLF